MPAPTDLTVGEVARATGLSVRVLRHWEAVGLVSPSRSGSGHRRYTGDDVTRVARAVALRRTGLSLAEVATLLDGDSGATQRLLAEHLRLLDADLRRRSALRDRLAAALDQVGSDEAGPAGPALMEVVRAMVLRDDYVHGYHETEGHRLGDQARTLADLLHHDTSFAPDTSVLELGCGVGAQSLELLRRSPGVRLTCVDRSADSLRTAGERLHAAGHRSVSLVEADLFDLPRPDGPLAAGRHDHVVVCFVLEHLTAPDDALRRARRLLRPGGTLTVIEGDHGSTAFHPDSPAAHEAIACQTRLQRSAGGDPDIGRRLYPLLTAAGFADVEVTPRQVYVDGSRPDLAEGFVRRTFTAMVAGVRTPALAAGLTSPHRFDAGISDLLRTAEPDGVFSYTFYKATATAA
ncbi:methyltransferase [Jannaschia sp. R86511]|uniref:methyltransferase n=1 Tax=Jannaschia sp. R86511 TaxID=3093853 RepID=UPI0036D41265